VNLFMSPGNGLISSLILSLGHYSQLESQCHGVKKWQPWAVNTEPPNWLRKYFHASWFVAVAAMLFFPPFKLQNTIKATVKNNFNSKLIVCNYILEQAVNFKYFGSNKK